MGELAVSEAKHLVTELRALKEALAAAETYQFTRSGEFLITCPVRFNGGPIFTVMLDTDESIAAMRRRQAWIKKNLASERDALLKMAQELSELDE